jgi:hypothetical protein
LECEILSIFGAGSKSEVSTSFGIFEEFIFDEDYGSAR